MREYELEGTALVMGRKDKLRFRFVAAGAGGNRTWIANTAQLYFLMLGIGLVKNVRDLESQIQVMADGETRIYISPGTGKVISVTLVTEDEAAPSAVQLQ